MSNPIEKVPVSSIRHGDTVVIDGVWKTVSRKFLGSCPLMGASIYGDCRAPHRTIDVVLFPVWSRSGLQGYARQIN